MPSNCSRTSWRLSTKLLMGIGSKAARNRFGNGLRSFEQKYLRGHCRLGSMRRKPLFPPPQSTQVDPVTRQATNKRKRNKGRQLTSRLTVNGRIRLCRRWWHASQGGSECPADRLLSALEDGVSRGVRE